ncbi:MAG: hypothetical protein J6A15_09030 [Clostridia bacterium]|nr:hypothetical protein [Clostridia bacterium]
MEETFVLLTDDIDISAYVEAEDIIRVRGGLKPSCDDIKWYTPPSSMPEYYSEWQEYERMDLNDGKSARDEVLDDGRYHPGVKHVVYSKLKDTTVRMRPSKCKDILAMVNTMYNKTEVADSVIRQTVAKLVGQRLDNPNIKHVICEIADLSDVITLEDIFATIYSVDTIEHDILKNEIKLYIFDPYSICRVSEEDKYKAYLDVKRRVEAGFYKKKLNFLDMLRYDKTLEPKTRDSYLRCGVMLNEGETSEQCYDRVKSHLEQVYRDFERYKDSFEDFKTYIINKIPRAITTERNKWDMRYNDEAITEALVQGYVRFFSGLYISGDAEMNICEEADKRRRFRYNRSFQVTNLAIFDSDALELQKIIDIEEIRLKNIEAKKREEQNER